MEQIVYVWEPFQSGYGIEDQMEEPCFGCSIEDVSDCCNAPMISDICTQCGEHCESTCKTCKFK